MARIDASAPGETPRLYDEVPNDVNARTSHRRPPRSYRWLAIAAAIQTIAIAFLLTLVWQRTADVMTAPRFTTMESPTRRSEGAILRVVFKPETPQAR